jgi:small GTP-binding protein
MEEEYIFKVAVVGMHGVGKSTLVHQLTKDATLSRNGGDVTPVARGTNTKATIGVDFSSVVMRDVHPDMSVRLQLWDTAGTEQYEATMKVVYRNAGGALIVYDVCNRKSFSAAVNKWIPAVIENGVAEGNILVVGNMADRRGEARSNSGSSGSDRLSEKEGEEGDDSDVTPADVDKMTRRWPSMIHLETSAKKGHNVGRAGCALAEALLAPHHTSPKPRQRTVTETAVTIPAAEPVKDDEKTGGCPC